MSDTPEPTTSSDSPVTAPGAPLTVPQEQIDRLAVLVMHAMQLRNYVDLHRARLPADLVRRWDAWYQGLAQVLRRAQADQVAQRHVLGELRSYQAELSRYRDAFATHGGPSLSASASPDEGDGGGLGPALIGGAGLALGLAAGFVIASSRGASS